MMKNKIYDAAKKIGFLACDINKEEIIFHIINETLGSWISDWKRELARQLRKITEALDDGE